MKKIGGKPWILVGVFNFFLVLNLTISISAQSQPKYVPAEHITLACGSSSDTIGLDERKWTADANNKFQIGDQNPSTSSQASQPPEYPFDNAPYRTARLSRSEFSYSFPVTPEPKFLRLYFYPFNYPGFNSSDAFFSVKANSFTLLSNFSADIHARAYKVQAFCREFCLVIQDGERLNISFRPSSGMPDAYAFINAIEIMSMPEYLYYSPNDVKKYPVPLDPSMRNYLFDIGNDTAMEMMYRINVGGSSISAKDDTGLFRNWYDDSEYLTIDVSSASPVNTSIQINLIKVGNYTAPVDVYKTARTMGINKTTNDNYALTWEFKVDSSFTYLVRLHFCEFQPPIQQVSDRVYRIDIANETAEGHADVIEWSGGNGIPVYKDYKVMMLPEANEKQQNLSVALRTVSWRFTAYSDAILNGLEMFKLSNFDKNLAAPNPDVVPNPYDSTPATKSTKSKSSSKTTTIIIGSVAGGLVVLSLLFFLISSKNSGFVWKFNGIGYNKLVRIR